MPKKTTIRKEKRVMLTDAELVAKYGDMPNNGKFEGVITGLLSKPSPTAPAKVAKR